MAVGALNGSAGQCQLDLVALEIDWLFLMYCLGGLIFVSFLLEAVYHKLETMLIPHDHYLRILRRVFKELVILGTLAFTLLVIRDFTSLTHEQFQVRGWSLDGSMMMAPIRLGCAYYYSIDVSNTLEPRHMYLKLGCMREYVDSCDTASSHPFV
jgi:hypothetical protein